jgi:rare lipoprotein A
LYTHWMMRGRGLLLALSAACMIPGGVAAAQALAATPPPKADISMAGAGGKQKVRYGARVAITGFVGPRAGGKPVSLEYARRGSAFEAVGSAITKPDGSYRFTVRARRSGSYRTFVKGVASATASRSVTVVARLVGRSRRHVLGSRPVRVRGRLLPRLAGRPVRLQVRTRGGWKTVDKTRTRRGGAFRASFKPRRAGVYRLRARFAGDAAAAAASRKLKRIYVYRPSQASWYGPGLFGNATACGGSLSAGRLGVANKYLPCGTRVTFRYRGRSVTVPVIDRGPFSSGREWDLTAATKQRLRFGDVGVVWATH